MNKKLFHTPEEVAACLPEHIREDFIETLNMKHFIPPLTIVGALDYTLAVCDSNYWAYWNGIKQRAEAGEFDQKEEFCEMEACVANFYQLDMAQIKEGSIIGDGSFGSYVDVINHWIQRGKSEKEFNGLFVAPQFDPKDVVKEVLILRPGQPVYPIDDTLGFKPYECIVLECNKGSGVATIVQWNLYKTLPFYDIPEYFSNNPTAYTETPDAKEPMHSVSRGKGWDKHRIYPEILVQKGFVEENDGTEHPYGTDWNIRTKNFHLWADCAGDFFLKRLNPDSNQIEILVKDELELDILLSFIGDEEPFAACLPSLDEVFKDWEEKNSPFCDIFPEDIIPELEELAGFCYQKGVLHERQRAEKAEAEAQRLCEALSQINNYSKGIVDTIGSLALISETATNALAEKGGSDASNG